MDKNRAVLSAEPLVVILKLDLAAESILNEGDDFAARLIAIFPGEIFPTLPNPDEILATRSGRIVRSIIDAHCRYPPRFFNFCQS